jgi:hypothetical protein
VTTFCPNYITASKQLTLEGKRVWLKPGKRYLFGRYKTEGGMCTVFPHNKWQITLTTILFSPGSNSSAIDIPKTLGG